MNRVPRAYKATTKDPTHVLSVLGGEDRDGEAEKAVEEMVPENFPNLAKDVNLQNQISECTQNGINPQNVRAKIHHSQTSKY